MAFALHTDAASQRRGGNPCESSFTRTAITAMARSGKAPSMKPLPRSVLERIPEKDRSDPDKYILSNLMEPRGATVYLACSNEGFQHIMDRYFYKVATHALTRREDVPLSLPEHPPAHPPLPGVTAPESKHKISHGRLQMAGFSKGSKSASSCYWDGQSMVQKYGSDAVGVSADGCLMAIADGVGSTFSSVASMTAVHHMVRFYEQDPGRSLVEYGTSMAQEILKTLVALKIEEATTLTTVKYDPATRAVEVMHIGDCVVYIMDSERNIKFATASGRHQHNFPHSLDPDHSYTNESHYQFYRTTVEEDDLVILFSDGVADNFWPKDVAKFSTASDLAAAVWWFFRTFSYGRVPFGHGIVNCWSKPDDVAIMYRSIHEYKRVFE